MQCASMPTIRCSTALLSSQEKSIFSSSIRAVRTSWSVKAPEINRCFRACTASMRSSTVPWTAISYHDQYWKITGESGHQNVKESTSYYILIIAPWKYELWLWRDLMGKRYLHNESSDRNSLRLTNSMDAHDSLLFHSRIPPRVLKQTSHKTLTNKWKIAKR